MTRCQQQSHEDTQSRLKVQETLQCTESALELTQTELQRSIEERVKLVQEVDFLRRQQQVSQMKAKRAIMTLQKIESEFHSVEAI